jgi:O-acetyl-ADP-ribose deacetylase (regulator of RNase III)
MSRPPNAESCRQTKPHADSRAKRSAGDNNNLPPAQPDPLEWIWGAIDSVQATLDHIKGALYSSFIQPYEPPRPKTKHDEAVRLDRAYRQFVEQEEEMLRMYPIPLPPRNNVVVVDGDLFKDARPDASLAHCVGGDFVMGDGIAVQFRERFGNVTFLKALKTRVGEVAVLPLNDRFVFNLVTKTVSRHMKPTLEAFAAAVRNLSRLCAELGVQHLAMPQIGSGLDKLDWDVVLPIIVEEFRGVDTQVTIFKYTNPRRESYASVAAAVPAAAEKVDQPWKTIQKKASKPTQGQQMCISHSSSPSASTQKKEQRRVVDDLKAAETSTQALGLQRQVGETQNSSVFPSIGSALVPYTINKFAPLSNSPFVPQVEAPRRGEEDGPRVSPPVSNSKERPKPTSGAAPPGELRGEEDEEEEDKRDSAIHAVNDSQTTPTKERAPGGQNQAAAPGAIARPPTRPKTQSCAAAEGPRALQTDELVPSATLIARGRQRYVRDSVCSPILQTKPTPPHVRYMNDLKKKGLLKPKPFVLNVPTTYHKDTQSFPSVDPPYVSQEPELSKSQEAAGCSKVDVLCNLPATPEADPDRHEHVTGPEKHSQESGDKDLLCGPLRQQPQRRSKIKNLTIPPFIKPS